MNLLLFLFFNVFQFILGVFIYQESFTYLTVLGITVIIIGLTQLSIKN